MGEWGTRDAAAMTIRDAAVTMVKQTGHLEKVGGLKGGRPEATVGSLMILYTTPINPPPSRNKEWVDNTEDPLKWAERIYPPYPPDSHLVITPE
jgi:hypothetical protein